MAAAQAGKCCPPTCPRYKNLLFLHLHLFSIKGHATMFQYIFSLVICLLIHHLSLAGFDWRSSPVPQPSPDTASPVFPERPIRPKPKRSLRARLSPEQAESIIFPPAPPSSAQLFSFPYSQVDRPTNTPPRSSRTEHHQHTCECGAHQSDLESEEEEDDRHLPLHSSPTAERGVREVRGGSMNTAFAKPPKAPSTTSSADGYESFENTNNKKKRKIPNQSSGSSHHANLSAEMAGMGLSSGGRHAYDELDDLARSSHASAAGSVASGTGISGAGRGRYGRGAPRAPERRPLGASTNALNAAKSGPSPGAHQEYSRGIIEQGMEWATPVILMISMLT